MRLAVVGGRCFDDYDSLKNILDDFDKIDYIVSGGSRGADSLGEKYAKENNIETIIFKPNWKKYGRGAGVVRNKQIIENSDKVIAFWDGKSRGTKNSIGHAKKMGKQLRVVEY